MPVKNKVPELVAAKFGGVENINLSRVKEATGLNYATVSAWVNDEVKRADFPILERWCEYLGVQPGDILVYEKNEG